MSQVRTDRYGPYIRHNNEVWRPEPNHTRKRDLALMDNMIGVPLAPAPTPPPAGTNVKASSEWFLSISVTCTGYSDLWSAHGRWTGNSEDSWFANLSDLDDIAFEKKNRHEALQTIKEIPSLIRLLFRMK